MNKKVTIFDVAERAGVSHMTVSRFFNDPARLRPNTYERVQEAVDTLQYIPSAVARSLARGNTSILALIVTDLTNPFFVHIAGGVEDEARSNDHTMILGNTGRRADQERAYLDMFLAQRVAGIIMDPSPATEGHLALLRRHRTPVVFIDRRLPKTPVDAVYSDTQQGALQLTQHLIAVGHRRITFIGGYTYSMSMQGRLDGYRTAMEEAGLPPSVEPEDLSQQTAEAIFGALSNRRKFPDALLISNGQTMLDLLLVLLRHHIRVPDHVAVACIDDTKALAALDVTVVAQPAREIGRAATELLMDHINGKHHRPRTVVLPTELIVRGSCGHRA